MPINMLILIPPVRAVKGSHEIVENQFIIDISNNIPAQILVISVVIFMIFIIIKLFMKLKFFEDN